MSERIAYTVSASFTDCKTAEEWVAWLHGGHIEEVIRGGASDAEIVHLHTGLGNASAAAGFEDVGGQMGEAFGHPLAHRAAAQPFILKETELVEILVTFHFFARVPSGFGG